MYWEHTLAVALGFLGMSFLIAPFNSQGLSRKEAIWGGCLFGLSVWFRSELIAIVATLTFLIYFIGFAKYIYPNFTFPALDYLKKNREWFFVSTFLIVGLFFASNQIIYGRPLGIHGLLITENFSWVRRVTEAWKTFQGMSVGIFAYFPLAILSLYYLVLLLFQRIRAQFNLKLALLSLFIVWLLIGIVFFSIPQSLSGFKFFL